MPARPHAPDLVHERFKLLLNELAQRDPKGPTWGWQKRVAKRIGLAAPSVSAILSDQRRVAWNLATSTAVKLKLDPRFFTEENPQHWLRLMDLENRSDLQKRAYSHDVGALRRSGSELRALLREGSPDEQLIVGLTLAHDVLHSKMVMGAQRVQVAKADEQLAAIRRLATLVADPDNPVDRADIANMTRAAASDRDEALSSAFLDAIRFAVRDYALHERHASRDPARPRIDEVVEEGLNQAYAMTTEPHFGVFARHMTRSDPKTITALADMMKDKTPEEFDELIAGLRSAQLKFAEHDAAHESPEVVKMTAVSGDRRKKSIPRTRG